jgi:carbonic anhydrase
MGLAHARDGGWAPQLRAAEGVGDPDGVFFPGIVPLRSSCRKMLAGLQTLPREFAMRFRFAAFLLFASTVAFAQSHSDWTYQGKTGALVWGKIDPSYEACAKGHEQSPIDIRGARLDAKLKPIEFHYIAGGVTVENNGHTIQVNVHPGSYIVAAGVRYDLVQFHFHHPSEHTIRGKFADMELHLVHRSADGKLAVIAVLLGEQEYPNTVLATLWEHLPTQAGKSLTIDAMINPGGLLPTDRGYWTYTGSLTTPPCSEGVSWFLFENPISISRSQLRAFDALYKMNTRPIQDLHGRKIEANE